MPKSFSEQVVRESTLTLKDWIKSQIILTAITLTALLIGLYNIGIEHWILASIAITFIDLLPVLGLSVTMTDFIIPQCSQVSRNADSIR